jgi:hypothetical protein
MRLKPTDKTKLVFSLALLVLVPVVCFVYWLLQSSSDTAQSRVGAPATSQQVSLEAAQQSDLRQFLRIVQSDDTAAAAQLLKQNSWLAKGQRADDDDATALHLAHSVAMATLLLANGADLNARDSKPFATPLRWAAAELLNRDPSTPELIRFLESKGAAEPDIIFATATGDLAQMQKLLSGDGTILDERSADEDVLFGGCTPLQTAAYFGQAGAAKLLIQSGADVHDRSGWNNTEPLEKAAFAGNADVAALLVDHGAKIDGTDQDFTHSPLYNAAMMSHAEVVKILLAHGVATSPILVPGVRKAAGHPPHYGVATGTPQQYQQILALLGATPSTQSGS